MEKLRANKRLQLLLGLVSGIVFGFLLQRGGVTEYDVIVKQLLLRDFIVVKIMLTAAVTGMVGVYALQSVGLATLHPKPGSVGATVVGGLIFGVGFAVLGYCPGTVAGAVGQGALDALLGGVVGILLGAGLYAVIYPWLQRKLLSRGDFGAVTLPEALGLHPWIVVPPVAAILVAALYWIERAGL